MNVINPYRYAGVPPFALTDFIVQVKTDNPGTSSSTQFRIPTNGTNNYDVITSDGQYITGNTGDLTITFPSAGTYEIAIRGTFPWVYFNNAFDRRKLLDVQQWGDQAWAGLSFYGCSNMAMTATDAPDLSGVTSFVNTFLQATAFNADLSGWDVSTITNFTNCFRQTAFNGNITGWNTSAALNMSFMFNAATSFNQAIGGWTTTSVTNMSSMFQGATTFNQSLNSWNVAAVTNFSNMFNGATAFNGNITSWTITAATTLGGMFIGCTNFNQNIGGWNTTGVLATSNMFQNCTNFNQNISSWDMSAVTNMGAMFSGASAFNQNISGWIVSACTNMVSTFASATAFDQDIGGWNVASVTAFTNFMSGKTNLNYSAANLDSIYNNWSLLTVTASININFNTIKYTAAGQAGRDVLTGAPNNWTITDGGT